MPEDMGRACGGRSDGRSAWRRKVFWAERVAPVSIVDDPSDVILAILELKQFS